MSTPDPGDSCRPLRNGRASGLLVDDFATHQSRHQAAYGAAPNLPLTSQLVAEQSRILDAELAALLAEHGDSCGQAFATSRQDAATLPGFESLPEADPRLCPRWCVCADLPVHSDGFDQDPDSAPHRGVRHAIPAIQAGGEGIDHAGRADVTVQLEQDRDLWIGTVVTLSVAVQEIEQYAWLAIPEARALHQAIGYLISETDG